MAFHIPPVPHGSRAFPPSPQGSVEFVRHESEVLRDNPLDDPSVREVAVYRPPAGKTEGKPLLVLLSGYTGTGALHFPRQARYLQETLVDQIERMVRSRASGECTIVAPDARTALGGSQYLNSTATGRYEDYVIREIVPWAVERYHPSGIGILGHSSGGFGALALSMRHPGLFGGLLASGADTAFEYGYLLDVPKAVRALRKAGGPEPFLAGLFHDPPAFMSPAHPSAAALNMMAMASCYSPVPGSPGSFELPFDWETGAIDQRVWERWLAWDPVRMAAVPEHQKALRALRTIQLGAGTSDEWGLDVGTHRLFTVLKGAGMEQVAERYYPAGHFDYWPLFLDDALPALVASLALPSH